jgi:general secretion pathway protein L
LQNYSVIRLVRGRLAWYGAGGVPSGGAVSGGGSPVAEEPLWLDDDEARERLQATLAQPRSAPLFAAPGADVRLLQIALTPAEKKHIGKSLPFMLEEQVAEDIDELHFASAALDKLELGVAICSRERMDAWQALLEDFPGVRQWVPEQLLLPWREGEWSILLEGDEAVVRCARFGGFSVERELLPVMLSGLQAEQPEPAAIVVYGLEQAGDTALLPEALRGKVQWRRGNLGTAMMVAEQQPALNLLQGPYAARLPVSRWWREWRAVAVLFGVAFGLQLAAGYLDYLHLKRDNLALRGAVEASYRKAYPRGAIVDAETQLQRQLAALRGSGQTSGFVHLIEQVGEALEASPGTSVATINYNFSDRGGEMRMNIVAADFEAVERIRADINRAGLQAVMENSSAQGDRVRARLRVGEKS